MDTYIRNNAPIVNNFKGDRPIVKGNFTPFLTLDISAGTSEDGINLFMPNPTSGFNAQFGNGYWRYNATSQYTEYPDNLYPDGFQGVAKFYWSDRDSSTSDVTQFWLSGGAWTGDLDLSRFTNITNLRLDEGSPSSITFKKSSSMTSFSIGSLSHPCQLYIYDVPSITNYSLAYNYATLDISINRSDITVRNFNYYNNTDTSILDMSMFIPSLYSATINIFENPDLQTVIWPAKWGLFTSSGSKWSFLKEINVYANGLDQTTVDDLFSSLNTFYTGIDGIVRNLSVYCASLGYAQAEPTDGYSNSDILNIQSIFTSKGKTFSVDLGY